MDPRDPVRIELTDNLLDKLHGLGLIQHKKLLACDQIAASTLCRRRLPVVLCRLKFAETLKEAATIVEQGHLRGRVLPSAAEGAPEPAAPRRGFGRVGHNVEVLGASGTKKSRFGAWKVKSLVLAEFKLRRNAPSAHTLRWRSVRRVRVAHEPVLPQGGGRGTLEGASNGRHSYKTDFFF